MSSFGFSPVLDTLPDFRRVRVPFCVFSLQRLILLPLAIMLLGDGATIFAFGHDSIPCFCTRYFQRRYISGLSFKAVVVRDFDGLQTSCSVFEHGCRTGFRARVFATVALRSSFVPTLWKLPLCLWIMAFLSFTRRGGTKLILFPKPLRYLRYSHVYGKSHLTATLH